MRHLHLLALVPALAASAGAQGFNIDFGSAGFGFGVPASTFGAAGNQPGTWNGVDTDLFGTGPYITSLLRLDGSPSGVTLNLDPLGSGGFLPLEFDGPTTTGDAQALFDDCFYNSALSTFTISGLTPGEYRIFTYAMAPDSNAFFTSVEVTGSPDGIQLVGGDFAAGFQSGVTHSEHRITVTAGGSVTINTDVGTSFDSINGLQIVPLGPGGLGNAYCTANNNSTGVPAAISAQGSSLVAQNNVTLTTSSLPLNAFGFYLTSLTQGNIPNPGGSQGRLCLGGQIGRYVGPGQIRNSGATGSFSLALNLTQQPTPSGFVAVAAGQTWNFTTWYRDVIGGSATSNFSNGLSIAFQ